MVTKEELEPQASLERLDLEGGGGGPVSGKDEDGAEANNTTTVTTTNDPSPPMETGLDNPTAPGDNATEQPSTEVDPHISSPDVKDSVDDKPDSPRGKEDDDDAASVSSSFSTNTTSTSSSCPPTTGAKDSATEEDNEKLACEALAAAARHKEEGNGHYQSGKYEEAARSYRRGCGALKKHSTNFLGGDEQIQCCWIALQTNLSMVLWKQGKYRQSANVATKVLERHPEHVKALYRRAVARRKMGCPEEARDDLRAALRADPDNITCKKELVGIKKELEESKEAQKRALSRAFSNKSSSLLYDDKEEAERRREEKKKQEKIAQQELYKKRKQEWEDECVKRMAMNEPAITFEEWETEKKEEEKRKKYEEKAQKAKEKEEKERLQRERRESARSKSDSNLDDSDDEDLLTEKELAMMRGYKKTKDGRVTSYFTRELSEEEKRAYDTAPKRLNEVSNTAPSRLAIAGEAQLSSSELKGRSAWNLAGTWEEKDTSAWCTGQLQKRLEDSGFHSLADEDFDVSVVKVEKLDGHASVAIAGGKKRYIFEYEASLEYEIKSESDRVVASGVAQLPDISSTHLDDDLEILFDSWKKRPGPEAESKALKARSNFVDQVRLQVKNWVQDFNEQY